MPERNVLHEAKDGNAIVPRLVGLQIARANLSRQRPPCAAGAHGPAAKGIEAADKEWTKAAKTLIKFLNDDDGAVCENWD